MNDSYSSNIELDFSLFSLIIIALDPRCPQMPSNNNLYSTYVIGKVEKLAGVQTLVR